MGTMKKSEEGRLHQTGMHLHNKGNDFQHKEAKQDFKENLYNTLSDK